MRASGLWGKLPHRDGRARTLWHFALGSVVLAGGGSGGGRGGGSGGGGGHGRGGGSGGGHGRGGGTEFGECLGFALPRAEDCLTAVDESCDGATPACPTVFSKRYGRPEADAGRAVAIDPSGAVIASGSVAATGAVDFGGGLLDSTKPNGGGKNAYLVKLSDSGAHVWSKRFNDPMEDDASSEGRAIVTDAAGNIFLAGQFTGAIDFGGGALTSMGYESIFVAKLSPAGAHVYSKMVQTGGDLDVRGIAIDQAGSAVVIGGYETYIDFGSGPILSPVLDGKREIFLVKLDPSGAVLWGKAAGAGATSMARPWRSTGRGACSWPRAWTGAWISAEGPSPCRTTCLSRSSTPTGRPSGRSL